MTSWDFLFRGDMVTGVTRKSVLAVSKEGKTILDFNTFTVASGGIDNFS